MSAFSFKALLDNDTHSVAQPIITKPLREMAPMDRKALGHGPTITLMVGQTIIADKIPKRAAMGISEFLNSALVKYPCSSKFKLNPAEVDEGTISTLVDFIVGNSHAHNPFNLQTPRTFTACINLYHHAILFGMEPYTRGLHKAILKEIYAEDITPYYALDKLVKLPTTDPCYVATVQKFEGLMFIGELDGDKDWEAWLGEHPTFVARMEAWKVVRETKAVKTREVRRAARWE